MAGGSMVRGGVAGLRSRGILSPCLCTIDCGMPPQGSLYISTEAWRSFRCKVVSSSGVKTQRRGGIPTWPCRRILPMEKKAAEEEELATQIAWDLRVGLSWSEAEASRQGTALSQLPHASALSSLEPGSCSSAMEGKMYCCPHGESTFVLFYILCFCSVSPQIWEDLGPWRTSSPISWKNPCEFSVVWTCVKYLFS